MKSLLDDHEVPNRGYYYLLDWLNMNGYNYIIDTFNKYQLHKLTLSEYKMLFAFATSKDYKTL